MDVQCNITDLITRGSLGTETHMRAHTHKEQNVKMKAEIEGMHLQATVLEITSKPPEARGQAGKLSAHSLQFSSVQSLSRV